MDNITEKIRLNHDKLYLDNTLTAIKVTGTDSKKFLQGQLTNDMENLSDKYIHASYCTHQGKVIVNVQAFLCDEEIILLLTKSLSKYFLEKSQNIYSCLMSSSRNMRTLQYCGG